MQKIIDYYTASSCSGICNLDEEVREYMMGGWQPYGSPYSATFVKDRDDAQVVCYQAMVKYEPDR